MKSKRLWVFIAGFLFLISPSTYLIGQQRDTGFIFDSIYKQGISEVNSRISVARQCLNKLALLSNTHTPVQEAKVNFLKLKIFYADDVQAHEVEKRMITAPDSLGHMEALVWSAARYLEKSMPDRAIPLLMEAIQDSSGSDWTTWCTVYLCEAYREKQEYLKGSEMLNEILYKKGRISDLNRAFAYNRLAAIYNEWGKPPASYPDSVMKYSELCISLSEKLNSLSNLAFSQNELSFQYFKKKQYSKALGLSVKSVGNFKVTGMNYSAMNALINQSNIYVGMNEYGLALQGKRIKNPVAV